MIGNGIFDLAQIQVEDMMTFFSWMPLKTDSKIFLVLLTDLFSVIYYI